MQNDTTPRVSAAIDWLTITASDPHKQGGLWRLGDELIKLPSNGEDDAKPWRWKGYSGVHRGGVTWGGREDGVILQLSGPLADEWFDVAFLHCDNCTRLDLAVTVWGGGTIGNLAAKHGEEVLAWKRQTGSTLSVTTICNDGEPATLYLGQRVSDTYARIYDKCLESGDDAYAGAWRFEIELKADKAERTASHLHSAGDRPNWIRKSVFQFFSRRGCVIDGCSVDEPLLIRSIRPVTDDASRLSWLARDVRPAVLRLLKHGHGDRVWEALGIPRSLAERYRLSWLADPANHHHDDLLTDDDA